MSHLPIPRPGSNRVVQVAPSATAGSGRRVLAIGRIRRASDCCGGARTAKVRIGGLLYTVECRQCSPAGV